MAKKKPQKIDLASFDKPGVNVYEVSLQDEMSKSYLEYSYSVVYSRSLPDARDGLKPVQRRILYSMHNTGLRPEKKFVKSASIVGDVMGKFHPHGDSAIYDALVRLVQNWLLNNPLIEGHGNFGSPDDGPAASRYTEAKPSAISTLLTSELNEGTVDHKPTYDSSNEEPVVLPAQFPNLLVNGSSGIAVGMATKMIPHNLNEVVKASIAILKNPDITLKELMRIVPGPDLPTGGRIIGTDQIAEAYKTGRGIIRMRATATVEPLQGSRGRQAIIITELPYGVGPEKVIEFIKDESVGKMIERGPKKGQREAPKISGVADIKDLTDLTTDGIRLQIECKSGVNPNALLANLYKHTPLESSFGINNLSLVDGQPQTLGLKELIEVFLKHRREVVTRRTTNRKNKREARLHVVEGLLKALVSIDDVIKIIRGSENPAEAKQKLMKRFKLSETQAQYILDTQLRRLTKLDGFELNAEKDKLEKEIAELKNILDDPQILTDLIITELEQINKQHPTPRRTIIVKGDLKEVLEASQPATPLEVADDPCQVIFSATGGVVRTATESDHLPKTSKPSDKAKHMGYNSVAHTTARGQYLLISNQGRAFKAETLNLPVINAGDPINGTPTAMLAPGLNPGEKIVGVSPTVGDETDLGLALGTKQGVIKICAPEWPVRSDVFEVISLKPGDEVLNAQWVTNKTDHFVFVADDASMLHFDAGKVRPQGIKGAGVAGMTLKNNNVISFNVADPKTAMVVSSTGGGTKITPLSAYPAKGRATAGMRIQRFLKGETKLVFAYTGDKPHFMSLNGSPLPKPAVNPRRDASGSPIMAPDVVGTLYEVEDGNEQKTENVTPAKPAATRTPARKTASATQQPAATRRRANNQPQLLDEATLKQPAKRPTAPQKKSAASRRRPAAGNQQSLI